MSLEGLCKKTQQFKNVFLYGAGNIGRAYYALLTDKEQSVTGYLVSEKKGNEQYLNGIRVTARMDVSKKLKQEVLVVISILDAKVRKEIYNDLTRDGFKHVYMPGASEIKDIENYWEKKRGIRNQMMYPVRNDISLKGINILVVAPHPDDEVIGCGGLLARFFDRTDVLCINSSGVAYQEDRSSAENIANVRVEEFNHIMNDLVHVNKSRIAKIWGVPPMFEQIERHIDFYVKEMNWTSYRYVFVPHPKDGHREHRFVSTCLLPRILSKVNYDNRMRIGYYEVWSAISDPNYYLDISNEMRRKELFINAYMSRAKGEYAKRIVGLNQYRGMLAGCGYAEAYKIISVQEYLQKVFDDDWRRPL